MNVLIDVDNLLTIVDTDETLNQISLSIMQSMLCTFHVGCLFCMSACKQDDVVVIEMGALFMCACFANCII